ncbi:MULTISPECIES: rod shape-determining protein MreD [unclassified Mucilaginibacter]|uniref:rod shape-determining protein MreD n=1 Tax=unclassified Mucilaginibacter TaxID=2617802 RepID=UPI002AC9C45E|nr:MULTISPECIES: rod shape-determining protein MreD [unclassified Mucilaginibacter]MEB0261346.1 rod shape-determining protein MreD [Mucilaginibacter sp. 10I4]MEB0278155.1 rod shape-determining protein MreD [Mucilaginibacter sp. 10B2]MEB0301389.1 rod shape-determining protein MreD [Mucilaginibacter sp. 5C4]WPX23067.1 rod shape-determining protein MreD [Mucilaginibacter sp. 5C4]
MSRILIINLIRFVVLVALQVFLLKNISLYNLSTPYLYILFIMLLPFETPNVVLFALAFVLGLTIDAFYDTPGLHAASCTLLALVRIMFISITVQKDGFDNEPEPTLSIMGFRWFFTYALILTLFHHFFLFNLEVFRFDEIGYTLSRFIFSSIFTVFLMLVSGLLFFRKKERK